MISHEPSFHWRSQPFDQWLRALLACHPRWIAIDGRGGAGKSTLAARMSDVTGAPVVYVDDVSWSFSRFGWAEELKENIVAPVNAGEAVDYRPPGWVTHNRPGSIRVPGRCPLVIIEGTGLLRPELEWDTGVWVAGDLEALRARCIERGEDPNFYDDWQVEELPFIENSRPWLRADDVVDGSNLLGETIFHTATHLPE